MKSPRPSRRRSSKRRTLFDAEALQCQPDVESVRLLQIVLDFARSAVIAAHPELAADPTDDDDPPELDTVGAFALLDAFKLFSQALHLYERLQSLAQLRRAEELPF